MCTSSPSPPPPPPEPAPAPEVDDEEVQERRRRDLARRQLAQGRGSTILTSGLGVQGRPETQATTILGRTQ